MKRGYIQARKIIGAIECFMEHGHGPETRLRVVLKNIQHLLVSNACGLQVQQAYDNLEVVF